MANFNTTITEHVWNGTDNIQQKKTHLNIEN